MGAEGRAEMLVETHLVSHGGSFRVDLLPGGNGGGLEATPACLPLAFVESHG